VRGAGCREINLRIRRREKNVLDIPFYRPGRYTQISTDFDSIQIGAIRR
jgi:hypothetical protein